MGISVTILAMSSGLGKHFSIKLVTCFQPLSQIFYVARKIIKRISSYNKQKKSVLFQYVAILLKRTRNVSESSTSETSDSVSCASTDTFEDSVEMLRGISSDEESSTVSSLLLEDKGDKNNEKFQDALQEFIKSMNQKKQSTQGNTGDSNIAGTDSPAAQENILNPQDCLVQESPLLPPKVTTPVSRLPKTSSPRNYTSESSRVPTPKNTPPSTSKARQIIKADEKTQENLRTQGSSSKTDQSEAGDTSTENKGKRSSNPKYAYKKVAKSGDSNQPPWLTEGDAKNPLIEMGQKKSTRRKSFPSDRAPKPYRRHRRAISLPSCEIFRSHFQSTRNVDNTIPSRHQDAPMKNSESETHPTDEMSASSSKFGDESGSQKNVPVDALKEVVSPETKASEHVSDDTLQQDSASKRQLSPTEHNVKRVKVSSPSEDADTKMVE